MLLRAVILAAGLCACRPSGIADTLGNRGGTCGQIDIPCGSSEPGGGTMTQPVMIIIATVIVVPAILYALGPLGL